MLMGMSLPQAGGEGSRENIAHVAREAERIGLDSLWVLDRLLRPLSPISRVPGEDAELLPEFYGNVFDPLETLTFAAALTERVQLGTSVVNAMFHPPVILARRFATLDQLSGGRAIAGLGQGWMREEFEISGTPLSRRGPAMVEYVEALRAVWGSDPVSRQGKRFRIPESEIGPKPLHPGGIPVIVGAYAPVAIERAATFADGFNPLATTLADLTRQINLFRSAAERAGRDPARLSIIVRANATLTARSDLKADRQLFQGTLQQWLEDLDALRDLGIDHTFFSLDGPIDRQIDLLSNLRQAAGRSV